MKEIIEEFILKIMENSYAKVLQNFLFKEIETKHPKRIRIFEDEEACIFAESHFVNANEYGINKDNIEDNEVGSYMGTKIISIKRIEEERMV